MKRAALAAPLLLAACIAPDAEPGPPPAPEIVRIAPIAGADVRGAGSIRLVYDVHALDAEPITIRVAPSGVEPFATQPADCSAGCRVEHLWSTATLPNGAQRVQIVVEDAGGLLAQRWDTFDVADVVRVTGLELVNVITDQGFTTLDVEVHLFDDATGKHLGCAGVYSGLDEVTRSNVYYELAADLVDANHDPLALRDLPGGGLRFEVWEDDDDHRCPSPPNPDAYGSSADDFLGRSQVLSLAEWRAHTGPLAFEKVKRLDLAFGRPFSR